MRQAGEVTYADAHKERANEGVIEFRSYSDMQRALDNWMEPTSMAGRFVWLKTSGGGAPTLAAALGECYPITNKCKTPVSGEPGSVVPLDWLVF